MFCLPILKQQYLSLFTGEMFQQVPKSFNILCFVLQGCWSLLIITEVVRGPGRDCSRCCGEAWLGGSSVAGQRKGLSSFVGCSRGFSLPFAHIAEAGIYP